MGVSWEEWVSRVSGVGLYWVNGWAGLVDGADWAKRPREGSSPLFLFAFLLYFVYFLLLFSFISLD